MSARRGILLIALGVGILLIFTMHKDIISDPLWWRTPMHFESLTDDITIVTSYINIGDFFKRIEGNVRGPNKYMKWIKVFGRINNPVVAFFDDEEVYENFTRLRSEFAHKTKTILIKREDLWSFGLRERIAEIFRTPGYPHHLPNTVLPEYSCVMHAKFEFLQKVAEENYFHTKYISWLDIGLFRFDKEDFSFGLWLPSNFDSDKVSYSKVGKFDDSLDPQKIVFQDKVWVSGAMNLARVDVMATFTRDYMRFVNYCLESNFISTDQQVLYGMYTKMIPKRAKPSIEIQPYSHGPGDPFFQLGYICRNEWLKKQARVLTKSAGA